MVKKNSIESNLFYSILLILKIVALVGGLFFIFTPLVFSQTTISNGNCSCQVQSTSGVSILQSGGNCIVTFSYTGQANRFYLPGRNSFSYQIKGAAGYYAQNHDKGYGAAFSGTIFNVSSQYFVVEVGQKPTTLNPAPGGWPNGGDGGNNGSGAGGGATRVYSSDNHLLLIAGAGGGGNYIPLPNDGFDANGATPGAGFNANAESGNTTTFPGLDSNDGRGGDANYTYGRQVGGGGGGYAGGGAGYNTTGSNETGGDGGRGSSYFNTSFTSVSTSGFSSGFNTNYSSYVNSSNGEFVITFQPIGRITVVSSGGVSVNNGWTFSNGIINATQDVNCRSSA